MLLGVEVVENGEVFDELLDVGAEVAATRGARQDVGGAQVHQAALAEGVPAAENARDLLLIVVLVEADRALNLHPVLLVRR